MTRRHGMSADFSRYYYCLGTIIFRCGCGDSDYNGEKNGRTSVCFTRIKLASGLQLSFQLREELESQSIIHIRLMLTVAEVYHPI